MTTEELLALPEDGVERWLLRGELREKGSEKDMTRRNRRHSRGMGKLAYFLESWRLLQPEPRGELLVGDVGFRLRRNPDTTVGIDLAYISAQLAAGLPQNVYLIDGIPILAVEILSPSDDQDEILEKVSEYLAVGIPLVWVIEPVFQTVTVYRPGAPPELFNTLQELTGDPHLPGFRVRVADIF
jgi:Uma2 family endonuclease